MASKCGEVDAINFVCLKFMASTTPDAIKVRYRHMLYM